MKIHIVKEGESLYDLSQKYGIELEKIIEANPQIANPDEIEIGQKIKLPSKAMPVKTVEDEAEIGESQGVENEPMNPGDVQGEPISQLEPEPEPEPLPQLQPEPAMQKHVVVQGDTLWKLSKAWGVPLQDMIAANKQLKNPHVLLSGEVVNIPLPNQDAGHPDHSKEYMTAPMTKEQLTAPIPKEQLTAPIAEVLPPAPPQMPSPVEQPPMQVNQELDLFINLPTPVQEVTNYYNLQVEQEITEQPQPQPQPQPMPLPMPQAPVYPAMTMPPVPVCEQEAFMHPHPPYVPCECEQAQFVPGMCMEYPYMPQYAPEQYAPEQYAPGQYAPGQFAPEQYAPMPYASGQFAPEQYAPMPYAPGQFTPDQYAPGQYAPEQYAPMPHAYGYPGLTPAYGSPDGFQPAGEYPSQPAIGGMQTQPFPYGGHPAPMPAWQPCGCEPQFWGGSPYAMPSMQPMFYAPQPFHPFAYPSGVEGAYGMMEMPCGCGGIKEKCTCHERRVALQTEVPEVDLSFVPDTFGETEKAFIAESKKHRSTKPNKASSSTGARKRPAGNRQRNIPWINV